MKPLEQLQSRLGYRFKEPSLLVAAMTHASMGPGSNYERLEFLGDRVLGLVMASWLYETFPGEVEGDLAKRHAALVQGALLAEIAREWSLGDALILSDAERGAGGADNENMLADGFEALLGALYLDAGLAFCHDFIRRSWGERIRLMVTPPQDPKTALQEWAQGRGYPLPLYELVNREGPDHAPNFLIRVAVQGYPPAEAEGSSRRSAEKAAARQLLSRLEQLP
ncbi:MAG: ribonuclease III [Micavibrio aeruginosavorus]|uniref:Ribonuclease 3 n=1 Tax=Micavibrio aeruginosavorus TaxID=349221 RepID=A0A7T5UID4_9BACT|nr:MAG: ribonuclease III [Micavibrio aeruginosavorus]